MLTFRHCGLAFEAGFLRSEIRSRIPDDDGEGVGLTIIGVVERIRCGRHGSLVSSRAFLHIGARISTTPGQY